MKFGKTKKTKNFNLKWFNKKNIDLVDDKFEIHFSNLLDIDEYLKLNRELQKMESKLHASLSPEQRKIMKEYESIELSISSYHTALGYYLGLNEDSKIK